MTELLVGVLLALAAISLGLRVTNALIPSAHPLLRLIAAALIGSAASTGILEVCDRYHVHDLGLGLLISLAPVGIFDLLKWWFRWNKA